ncbi:winged helix DNA-binding domain-containing protein [Kitasatospora sp. NA04385]|uniref:DNA glycosylase AlkZ-like family protein n=1 Tax=Kitasatospora sp. NA04385 TaxID=2742135 RepID=UPI0015914E5F|nr:crosslink repair DNA glycosylase YcaQ family protein [Kitasatospora sp. NA04385]QKW18409.1 winged helix DNA-binding domain-containing protein [Kitasatospora sp. NA04385]
MGGTELTTAQVLEWRLRRQHLDADRSADGPVAVARRLAGVQAQVPSAAELAVALRTGPDAAGALRADLAEGRLLRTWAQRGTLHLLDPRTAADALALIGSARTWEKPAWTRQFGATPDQVARLVEAVGELLRGAVLTREELAAALTADPGFAPLAEQLASGWGALLKPLAWQGVLCHAPAPSGRVAFTHPADHSPDWPGLPPVDEAGPRLLAAYLGAYGPAGLDRFDAWLSRNSLRKGVLKGFAAALGDRLTDVTVDGAPALALTEHLDELAATTPTASVHLLGAFDQYVLGPGTKATEVLPAAHRARVSRTAGWIAPLLLVDGRIAGTWEQDGPLLTVTPFEQAPPAAALAAAAERLAAATGTAVPALRVAGPTA